ncbi:MAG: hypothetical protein QGG40_14320 [Myxococcota bacterium]|jgi:flagellar motility protein MotE (MotC chaperone)|nr:hypothetical protein [Myxococcota bacterium]
MKHVLLIVVGLGLAVAATAIAQEEIPNRLPTLDEISLDWRSEGAQSVLDQLARKDRALQRREATLSSREADIRAAEEQVEKRLAELQTLRTEVRALLEDLDAEREARVAGLVKMFEGMRSNEAALILAVTEEGVALEVLMRMNRSKAGKALADMNPAQAARFTEVMGAEALSSEVP